MPLESVEDEDEVLTALSDELGGFVEYVGGPEYAHVLLSPLENLASIEEPLVREKVGPRHGSSTVCIDLPIARPSSHSTRSVSSYLSSKSSNTLFHLPFVYPKPTGSHQRSPRPVSTPHRTKGRILNRKPNSVSTLHSSYMTTLRWSADRRQHIWESSYEPCPRILLWSR